LTQIRLNPSKLGAVVASEFQRRIVVVDDEAIIRTLVAERLEKFDFQCFIAGDALTAKKLVLKHDPDALIVDLDLGDGPSGTELISALAEINSSLGFVLLTNYIPAQNEMKVAKNLRYVSKKEVTNIEILVEALESVLRYGQRDLEALTPGALSKLTKGQLEILGLLSKGLSNAEISAQRKVGLRAVEQSIRRIYQALGLTNKKGHSNRVSAARIYSSEMGLRRSGGQS
jgi:DNA-binding NarL/FixJ family response regulator